MFLHYKQILFFERPNLKRKKIPKISVKGAFPDLVDLCLLKLALCLISADSNSNENAKIVSFIEDTHTSNAATSKISNLRTDQQELIC